MNSQQHDEDAVFSVARKLPDAQARELYLAQVYGSDDKMIARVQTLLKAHEESGFLESPPDGVDFTIDQPIAEGPGAIIGPYKLMEQIGEGGMGIVYVAQQRQPVRRKVALKIIKPGMDTQEVIARFEAERQALALMEHPNIARALDAGATESGRPYFVMELVRGIPITTYCDQNNLPTRDRLALFVMVCHAVKHAHQKGVIHRDVKPSNVMITLHDGQPVPKIIDFGVAKAINQRLTERTIYTRYAQMVGTPLYMSPEQAELSGLDVDTRTDIFSLGVLLYELLIGTTPFEKQRIREAAYDEVRRIIREEEPPKPSTRISTLGETATAISAQRKTDPKHLSQLMRGDLDWIVMKALEKDRTRRYETAGDFAADVLRHLNDEPIVAGPPSAIYKFQKFVRRNRAAMATVGLVTAAVLLGLVVSTWQAFRATREHTIAEQERNRAVLAEEQAIADRDRAIAAERNAKLEKNNAEQSREQATAAAAKEAHARQSAEEAQSQAERYLHVARLNVASHAWENANLRRVRELLDLCRPGSDQTDHRGFAWYRLWRLANPNSLSLRHGAMVPSVTFSADGRILVSAGHDATIKMWDVETLRLIATLKGNRPVDSVAVSPDGKTLATGTTALGGPPELKLWDMDKRRERASLEGHTAGIMSLAFSGDGKTLASGDSAGTAKLWDVVSGEPLASIQSETPIVFAVSMSPDGETLAIGGGDTRQTTRYLTFWDVATHRLRATLAGHKAIVASLAFSPDGRTLASGSFDHSIRLWDVDSAEPRDTLQGHAGSVRALAYSADGKTLASGSQDRTIKLWDPTTGLEKHTFKGNADAVRSVAFSPDGNWLATGSNKGTVKFWDTSVDESRDVLLGHEGQAYGTSFSPDGKMLVSGSHDDTVKLWDVERGELIASFKGPSRCSQLVAFSPNGETIAATGDGGQVRLLDVTSGRERQTLYNNDRSFFSGVQFSPDGTTLAVAGTINEKEPTILLWDTTTGRQRLALKGHTGHVRPVCFSPDGETLVSGSRDKTIKVWETATGRLLKTLESHTDEVHDVRYSPDGKTLASASLDGTVKLWDVTSDAPRATLTGHAGELLTVAFSPDGRTLASAGNDRYVKLWHVASGQELVTLTGHYASVWSLAFSPDGNTLASTGLDSSIRLWRAVTEQDILLRQRALTIGSAEADEQWRIVTDLSGVLARKVDKGLTQHDVSLATSTGWALEDSGNHQLAATAFGQFAEAVSASNDERFFRQAKTWEGIAKRLGLVGTELELEGSLADGSALNWDAYRGKVVLVEFWPTWCSTDELTSAKQNYELYRDRDFDVVICNIGAEDDTLAEFLDDEDVPWIAFHRTSSSGDRTSPVYGVGQLPTSILIDRQGKVVSLDARGPQLNRLLEQLIGPP